MQSILGWKLKREIRRIGNQICGLLLEPYESRVRRRRQNACAGLSHPKFANAKKIAIFVVFQPAGVASSVFGTVRHLMQSGFATGVISNAPLSSTDRLALEDECTFLLQRENFGYDFGAYKDAIDALPNQGADLDQLLLLNDSVWFPATSDSRLLSELAAHPADVVAAQIFGEALAQQNKTIHQQVILGSYMLMFKNRALRSQAFRDFWRSYKMSSNKELTLRRGERGLSRALFEGGLQCAGVYSQHRFETELSSLEAAELGAYMREAIVLDPKLQRVRGQLLRNAMSPAWRRGAIDFLIENSKTKNFIGSSPWFAIERLGVEVVKKNNEMLYRAARQAISNALKGEGMGNFDPVVAREIIESADKDNLPKTVRAAYATR